MEGEHAFAASGTHVTVVKGGHVWVASGGKVARIFLLGGFRQDLVDPENPYDLRRAVDRSLFDRFSE